MGSIFGGGGNSTTTETITPPNPKDVPLQEPLMGLGTRQINQMSPFSPYGSGANLLPQAPLGQVYLPGPNPTTIGDPYNAAHAQQFFGPQSGSAPPGYGAQPQGSQQQGQGGGQGGQASGSPSPSSNGGSSAQQSGTGNYQAPPLGSPGVPANVGQSQMPHMLNQLLQPGVLGQLFSAYGQHLQGQGGGLGNQMPQGGQQQQQGQVPDTNGQMQRPPMQGVQGAGSVNPNVNFGFGLGGQQ